MISLADSVKVAVNLGVIAPGGGSVALRPPDPAPIGREEIKGDEISGGITLGPGASTQVRVPIGDILKSGRRGWSHDNSNYREEDGSPIAPCDGVLAFKAGQKSRCFKTQEEATAWVDEK